MRSQPLWFDAACFGVLWCGVVLCGIASGVNFSNGPTMYRYDEGGDLNDDLDDNLDDDLDDDHDDDCPSMSLRLS